MKPAITSYLPLVFLFGILLHSWMILCMDDATYCTMHTHLIIHLVA